MEHKALRFYDNSQERTETLYLSFINKNHGSPAVDSQKRKGEIHEEKEQIYPEFVTWINIEAKIPVALQWILAFFAF